MLLRILFLLLSFAMPACGTLRAANLLTRSTEAGLKFSPTATPWKISDLDTACFEARPTITFNATSDTNAEAIAAYYRQTLPEHGWSLDGGEHGTWVYASRQRSLPIPFVKNPLIYQDDWIEVAIGQHMPGNPTTIQITVKSNSHLDFPSSILIWLTGNLPPLKYLL